MNLNAFRDSMLECEIYRNGVKVATHDALINDSKDYNFLSFELDADIQVGDDIYCPLKRKHYIINNVDIAIVRGTPHRIDAYFESNLNLNKQASVVYNTYNPQNSVIGNQQNVVLNINDCFNNLQSQIDQLGNEDKSELHELLELLKGEVSKPQINKSIFSKFNNLIIKHSTWLIPAISQIICAWIQRG